MAWQVTKRIWDTAREIKQSDKLLLLALAEFADEQSVCWPSYETLAEMISVNRRSAIRIVENLEEWGHIYIDQHAVGRSNTNTFLIVTGLIPPQVEKVLIERFGKSPDDAKVSTNTLIGKQDDYRKGVTRNTKSFPETGRYKRLKIVKSVTHNTFSHSQKGVMRDKKVLPVTQKGVMDDTRTIIEPSTKPTKESKSGGKPPAPPGVTVFVEVTKRHVLNNTQIKEIDERVGRDPPALDRWRETVKAWQLAGNKINNVSGMLDWFKKGIPVYAQKASQNGTHRQNNKQSTPGDRRGQADRQATKDHRPAFERDGPPTPEQWEAMLKP